MSDHTDTIRRALQEFDDEVPQGDATLATDALAALDALVAENQRLRERSWRQQREWSHSSQSQPARRAALDGTP